MIWGCYSASGKYVIAYIEEHMNATNYCEVLEKHLLSFPYWLHGTVQDSFCYMHYGARPHTANITK